MFISRADAPKALQAFRGLVAREVRAYDRLFGLAIARRAGVAASFVERPGAATTPQGLLVTTRADYDALSRRPGNPTDGGLTRWMLEVSNGADPGAAVPVWSQASVRGRAGADDLRPVDLRRAVRSLGGLLLEEGAGEMLDQILKTPLVQIDRSMVGWHPPLRAN